MLASLLHNFDWKLEDGIKPEDVDMSGRCGLTLQKAMPLKAIPVRPKSSSRKHYHSKDGWDVHASVSLLEVNKSYRYSQKLSALDEKKHRKEAALKEENNYRVFPPSEKNGTTKHVLLSRIWEPLELKS
ncbi:hypothetical protein ACH5RR_029852 [Cinchona calisaya]|uniref:Uncharacterized protein n=1 Tax=Cinchona calisaya TaxID=153742 RepID=A0ABD2YUA7_9GENT